MNGAQKREAGRHQGAPLPFGRFRQGRALSSAARDGG